MCANVFSGPVTFDGETLVVDGVRLSVERCEVEGANFSFSPLYGLLLLKDETRGEAQKLLNELTAVALLSDDTKKDLIRQVCSKGFKEVWLELERYRQHIPLNGEPKFYAEAGYSKQLDGWIVSLVSAEKALRFYVSTDMQSVLKQLPINVYRSDMVHTCFSLTLERYCGLLGREKDFFVFVEELNRYMSYIRDDTYRVCFRRYFEDPVGAYSLLRVIRSKVCSRESRDQLFDALERNKVLEFSLGLFVRSGWSTFYVSKDGDVQRLCYSKQVETREAVLRAYQRGRLPTKLEEVTDNLALKRVAEIVGKTRPELTLLILP
jgi:hypothetical protein